MSGSLLVGELHGDDGPSVAQLVVQGEQLLLLPGAPFLLLGAAPRAFPHHCLSILTRCLLGLFFKSGSFRTSVFQNFFCKGFGTAFGGSFSVPAPQGIRVVLGMGDHGLRMAVER
jgi:hypothetical protein